ncbi:hypothetical protein [Streptomyces similanensis]|uniref:Uncharacterized protein n=1 Tax=Streptomyces similanensis TaxID=1274988 RepID=A0ABP9LEF8_9ACTN
MPARTVLPDVTETKPGAAVDGSRRRAAALTDEQRAERTALGMRGSSPGRPDLALRRAASIRYFGAVGYSRTLSPMYAWPGKAWKAEPSVKKYLACAAGLL